MRHTVLVIIATLCISFLFATCVSAEVPHLIRFQGKVTDKDGAPLNGAYNINFRIYNAETGGTLLWSETQDSVPVNNGIFTVLLGNVTDLDLAFDVPYWLSLEVNDDGEMEPRQRITSVGYAIRAEVAESIADVEVVPQGAIIIWRGETCPIGYQRVTELDSKFLASGPTYNPAAGGSNTHTHPAGGYKCPDHTHRVVGSTGWATQDEEGLGDDFVQGATEHIHSISITSQGSGQLQISGTSGPSDNRPEFATVILCEKE